MEPLSWSAAVAIIGSVATVAVTILKIFSMKKGDGELSKPNEDIKELLKAHDERGDELKAKVAVIENEIANFHERLERLEDNLEKLQDLFLKILTEKD